MVNLDSIIEDFENIHQRTQKVIDERFYLALNSTHIDELQLEINETTLDINLEVGVEFKIKGIPIYFFSFIEKDRVYKLTQDELTLLLNLENHLK